MAGKKEGGIKRAEFKALMNQYDQLLEQYNTYTKNFANNFNKMQEGDGKVAYWSGKRAYNWMTQAVAHHNNNVKLAKKLENIKSKLHAFYNNTTNS